MDGICYFRESLREEPIVFCSNENCPISKFHHSCILPKNISKIPKRWFCPHCRSFRSLSHRRRKGRSYQQTYCLYSQYVYVMRLQIKTTSCYVATVVIARMENISIFLATVTINCQITAKQHGYVSGVKPNKSRNHLPLINQKRTNILRNRASLQRIFT